MKIQSTLKSFLNIKDDDDSDEESAYIPSKQLHGNTIPLSWTRVRSV